MISAYDIQYSGGTNQILNVAESENTRTRGGDFCVASAGTPNGQSTQYTKRKGFELYKFPKDPM